MYSQKNLQAYINGCFVFFEKVTLRTASLGKLPCYVDFMHISLIAFDFSLFQAIECDLAHVAPLTDDTWGDYDGDKLWELTHENEEVPIMLTAKVILYHL